MKPHGLPVVLALCLVPCLVAAQVQPPAPVAERDDEALVPPELPEVPAELRASVEALRVTVERTEECYSAEGRMEHTPDPACPQWYARLARGGPAAVFAIGALFRPGAHGPNDPLMEAMRSSEATEERGPRLVQIMARTGRPEVVPFFVSYLVRTATVPTAYVSAVDAAMLAALRRLTGNDPAPTAPWEDDQAHLNAPLARRDLVQRWARWYHDHQGMTVAQWRAEGAARAARDLFSDDLLERYSAITRLAGDPTQRVAVRTALQTLLGREDLPAAARVHLHRLARQRGIVLPPAPALTTARRG